MVMCERSCHKEYTMQYESPIKSGLKVMAKVKVFVHATDADADADGRAMTLAPQTYMSRLAKKYM